MRSRQLGVLSWIVFGLIAGIIAKLLMPVRDPGGCIITILLGVAGAFVGGFLYRLVTGTEVLYFGFDFRSFAIAVFGSRGSPGRQPPHPKELSPRAERGEQPLEGIWSSVDSFDEDEQDRLALPALLEWDI